MSYRCQVKLVELQCNKFYYKRTHPSSPLFCWMEKRSIECRERTLNSFSARANCSGFIQECHPRTQESLLIRHFQVLLFYYVSLLPFVRRQSKNEPFGENVWFKDVFMPSWIRPLIGKGNYFISALSSNLVFSSSRHLKFYHVTILEMVKVFRIRSPAIKL